MTTSTEKMYAQAIGKLYLMPMNRWQLNRWEAKNPTKSKPEPTLLMPFRLVKHGGWWHYDCDILTNREYYHGQQSALGCKEFLRKAALYQIPAAESSEKI